MRRALRWLVAFILVVVLAIFGAPEVVQEVEQNAGNGILATGDAAANQDGGIAGQESGGAASQQSENPDLDIFCRTTYEVFVYSFCDSDGDGIGDLPGLLSKLDYINDGNPDSEEDLGMTGLWLMIGQMHPMSRIRKVYEDEYVPSG
ncbi:MAG: hypothetical protein Q4A32_04205 [Lachnospiraceae bacterium]|nr:hypothetical protein [Lachnospiraceae bacterium]